MNVGLNRFYDFLKRTLFHLMLKIVINFPSSIILYFFFFIFEPFNTRKPLQCELEAEIEKNQFYSRIFLLQRFIKRTLQYPIESIRI